MTLTDDDIILKNLKKEIEGITLPSQFSISLTGTTDQGVFDSLPGSLFITESSSESLHPFLVTLLINPDLFGTNGWIYLNTEENTQTTQNITIKVKNSEIHLEIIANQNMLQKYTLGADKSSPGFNREVLIEKCILTFRVDGDNIFGEIKASGIYFPGVDEHFSDFDQPSTYEANITGQIPKSSIVEKLKDESNWSVQDSSWQLPSFITTENLSPFDLQELRYLGQKLALDHKYKPASIILDYVITTYLKQKQAFDPVDIEKEQEIEGYLISAGFCLNFLIDCYFQIEDYPQLLTSLDYGLEIQHFLGPEESASRLFRRFTVKIANLLTSNAKQFSFMENSYKDWLQMVNGNLGIIGINVEKNNNNQEVIISSIEQGKSADLAGILPQDVILKIDKKTTQGLDEQQVLKKIKGKPETPVTITVRRNNKELEFQLTRTKIEMSSLQRQAELVETLQIFSNSLNALQKSLNYLLNQINLSVEKIAKGQENPVTALLSVFSDIEKIIIELHENQNVLINKGKDFFNKQKEALEELEFIFSTLLKYQISSFKNFDTLERFNTGEGLDIKELDAREKRMMEIIENYTEITSFEKKVFGAYYAKIISFVSFIFNLQSDVKSIKKMDAKKIFADNRERAKEITSNLSERIEIWRRRLKEDFAKIDALEQGQPFFNKALEFLISLNYHEEALVVSEKSRARAFADLLSSRFSAIANSQEILPSNVANSPTLEQIKKIAQEQNVILVEYAIIDDWVSQNPESKLLIWVVQPTGKIEFKSIDISQSINSQSLENLVKQARSSIGIEDNNNPTNFEPSFIENNKYFYPHFRQLNNLLIEPIIKILTDNSNVPIVFIPQKSLFKIPFSALQDENGDFLIQKHIILTAPSIQLLDLTHQLKNEQLDINMLVVGNPTMPSMIKEKGEEPGQLQESLASEVEAKVIATFFKTEAFINDKATKLNILQQMSKARLIHLATHGFVDPLRPLGIIVLAPSENDNGILATEEILEIFGQPQKPILPCELLVLSACQTGQGEIKGDGVIGLARSLMIAGASRVIVSLWQVDALATAFLMIKFYEILKDYVQLEATDVAKVINQAQKWLMGLSSTEAEQELEKLKPYIYQALTEEKPRIVQAYMTRYLRPCRQSLYPFASPKYWAGFTTIGL